MRVQSYRSVVYRPSQVRERDPLQPNGTFWLESTCYTSLELVTPTDGGRWAALVCYDDLGTEAPAAPSQCQHLKAGVHTFCMKVEEPPSPTPSSAGSMPWHEGVLA